MKPFHKKLIAGIIFSVCIIASLVFLGLSEHSEDYWMANIFLSCFQGGIIIWLYLNYKEAKKVKARREKEKIE